MSNSYYPMANKRVRISCCSSCSSCSSCSVPRIRRGGSEDAVGYGAAAAAVTELPASPPPTESLAWCPHGCHEGFGFTGGQSGHSNDCSYNTFEQERRLNTRESEAESESESESEAESEAEAKAEAVCTSRWHEVDERDPPSTKHVSYPWGHWDLRDPLTPKRVVVNSAALLNIIE